MTRSVALSKLVAVVTSLAVITLAAAGYRLSQPEDFAVVRGELGEPTAYADGSVVVDNVRVGTVVLSSIDDPISTPGMFVVVRVSARASGREELTVNHLQLLAQGATYLAAQDESLLPAPGFEESRDVQFEVDPGRLTDLTLEAWGTRGFVEAYAEHVRVPLGVTTDNVEAWRRAAQGRQVDYVASSVVRGLG